MLIPSFVNYFQNLSLLKKKVLGFVILVLDEAFGSLSNYGKFNEETKYNPRSP